MSHNTNGYGEEGERVLYVNEEASRIIKYPNILGIHYDLIQLDYYALS
jgi:hypothetical protein